MSRRTKTYIYGSNSGAVTAIGSGGVAESWSPAGGNPLLQKVYFSGQADSARSNPSVSKFSSRCRNPASGARSMTALWVCRNTG